MGDTSERSKPPGLPPRCPCGFWGSSKTMNLCSKCFADVEKKQPGEECSSKALPGSGSVASVFSPDPPSGAPSGSSSSSITQSLPPTAPSPLPCPASEAPAPQESPFSSSREASGTDGEETPEKRSRTEDKDDASEGSSTPKQKNRRRCFRCQTKLELVQQELGSCRCGYVFCMLHRLPEQHDCLFDHLGRGREEAVLKMVKLDRKVGRSCQRIGEECS
uniref:Zinc finger, AN1-type domain 3 n=1 Tax=Neogobius melanostomus TaxID=47308 RepID=A0A8C6THU6_9GOBI